MSVAVAAPRCAFAAALTIAAALALLALLSLAVGTPTLSPAQLLNAVAGGGPAWLHPLITQIRGPRLLAALVVGAALGVSGALLQTLARNHLAGPDVIGLNDGALLALAISLIASPAGMIGPWWCALLGALATAGLVLAAAGGVGTQGYRVLIVGIGVASLLRAGFDIALSSLPIMHAGSIYAFSVGSLSGRTLNPSLIAAGVFALLMGASLPLSRVLALMGLQDDSIRNLGVDLDRLRLLVLVLAAALAGLAVSVSGPIGFVAIAAPILARRWAASARVALGVSALIGASLVVAADTLGRVIAVPAELPAGVVCGLFGGPFLLRLLLRR